MPSRTVRVEAGSRLHAGFHTIRDERSGVDFAGAGFYIDEPKTIVSATGCEGTLVSGPEEAIGPAREALERLGATGVCVEIESAPPRHVGLGSTTQIMLATATAALLVHGQSYRDPLEAAWLGINKLGRARGSTVGSYLYALGGFALDPGVPPRPEARPVRLTIPEDWAFVVVLPHTARGAAEGEGEDRMLARVVVPGEARRLMSEGLRLLLLGLMRGVLETVLDGLRAMQTGTGMAFSRLQGGVFRRDINRIVDEAGRDGIVLAQSSWGPTLYTITRREWAESDAKTLKMILSELGVPGRVWVARPRNRGFTLDLIDKE